MAEHPASDNTSQTGVLPTIWIDELREGPVNGPERLSRYVCSVEPPVHRQGRWRPVSDAELEALAAGDPGDPWTRVARNQLAMRPLSDQAILEVFRTTAEQVPSSSRNDYLIEVGRRIAVLARADHVSLREAWLAAGGNPDMPADRKTLLTGLQLLASAVDHSAEYTSSAKAEKAEVAAFAAEDAVVKFMAGTHEVYTDPDSDHFPDAERNECLVARMQRYSDSGDESVGIPATDMWILSPDQSGTYLQALLEDREALRRRVDELEKQLQQSRSSQDMPLQPPAEAVFNPFSEDRWLNWLRAAVLMSHGEAEARRRLLTVAAECRLPLPQEPSLSINSLLAAMLELEKTQARRRSPDAGATPDWLIDVQAKQGLIETLTRGPWALGIPATASGVHIPMHVIAREGTAHEKTLTIDALEWFANARSEIVDSLVEQGLDGTDAARAVANSMSLFTFDKDVREALNALHAHAREHVCREDPPPMRVSIDADGVAAWLLCDSKAREKVSGETLARLGLRASAERDRSGS